MSKNLLFLFAVFCIILLAGCLTCDNFDDQTAGNRFFVGDVITASELNIDVERFQWMSGTWTTSGSARIDDRTYSGGTGIDINANNVTLHPRHDYPVHKITFDYGELGGNINITINGEFHNIENLISLNGTTAGGTAITVNGTQQGNNWYGDVVIEGAIYDFSIGGQELWVDNYCFKATDCAASDSDVTTGTTGSMISNQSFNETRAVLVRVIGTTDRVVESLKLKGLNAYSASSTLVGARIYDEDTQNLIASSDTTLAGSISDATVSVPVVVTLEAGKRYRIGFYVETTPLSGASGNFFESDAFSEPLNPIPYTETSGKFQIISAHAVGADSFPSNWNIFTPQITIHTTCLE